MDKVYLILTELSVKLINGSWFELKYGDIILCEKNPNVINNDLSIRKIRYRRSENFFELILPFIRETDIYSLFLISSDYSTYLYNKNNYEYSPLSTCKTKGYIEDITRDYKLNELIYEE